MINLDEQRLVKRAQAGDQAAYGELISRYEKKVYSLAYRMLKNEEDAEDVAQDAFLSAWQGLPNFHGESSFSTWLFRLTSNACIDAIRKRTRIQKAAGPSLDDEETFLEIPDGGDTPEEALIRKDTRETIESALCGLKKEFQEILILREIRGLSYDEIAELLSLDLGTVKSRINRARKQLCNDLQNRGNFSPSTTSKKARKEDDPA